MTIAALLALIDEELPAPRSPHLIRKAPPMDHTLVSAPGPVTPAPSQSAGPAPLQVGQLLKWASEQDAATRRYGERARAALDELRARHRAWQMLALVDAEEAELLKRLDAVRARREQLRPKRAARPALGYDAAVVRAWAREHGLPVPGVGKIPAPILAAWREATGGAQ